MVRTQKELLKEVIALRKVQEELLGVERERLVTFSTTEPSMSYFTKN